MTEISINATIIGSFYDNIIAGGSGNDTIFGIGGDDTLSGREGNDSIHGGTGHDSVSGGTGNDILIGSDGNDTLKGGAGNDTISGGGGKDHLSGDTGSDVFRYQALSESGPTAAARDVITGFTHSDDINLSAIDANTHANGNQAFVFVQNFSHHAGQLQWDKLSAERFLVSADVNGDGHADFSLEVRTAVGFGQPAASDFIL